MEATIVDLRYKMNDVMKALNRNEDVKILYRGTLKGILSANVKKANIKIADHPFFNMNKENEPVDEAMNKLRKGRYNDI
ncbi:MAG: type II toxin-antitoxin system Phd/YefM family antitoxin [Chlamydiae bacterium]|nr:MAG: type II toxin-antitoxin system Phd/YefM family antitoxin [Chlamydiota bacterium]